MTEVICPSCDAGGSMIRCPELPCAWCQGMRTITASSAVRWAWQAAMFDRATAQRAEQEAA